MAKNSAGKPMRITKRTITDNSQSTDCKDRGGSAKAFGGCMAKMPSMPKMSKKVISVPKKKK